MSNIRYQMSDKEMNRRWDRLKAIMAENKADMLIAQGNSMFLGGYVRWLTDIPAEYNSNMTVLFFPDRPMILIRSTHVPIPQEFCRNVAKVIYTPSTPAVTFTNKSQVEAVMDVIEDLKISAPAIVGKAELSSHLMLSLTQKHPALSFIDLTEELDQLKTIKSDEEIACVRKTAWIHDQVWAAFPAMVKPGMTEYQLRSEVIRLMTNLGCEEHLIFLGTAAPYHPTGQQTFQYANRRINEGDYGQILFESSGPGGYWCESARNFCLAEPFPELVEAWEFSKKAQQLTADTLMPGTPATEIVRVYNEYLLEHDYVPEGRLYGHSQGYDLIERPSFMPDNKRGNETMIIQAGMTVSLHPFVTNDILTVYINDDYLVTDHGAEKLHQTPAEMILL